MIIKFQGDDWMLTRADLTEAEYSALVACAQPGIDAAPAVDRFIDANEVSGNADTCRAYLFHYGAWDTDELSDHDANLRRLVWIVAGDIRECGEAYLSAY